MKLRVTNLSYRYPRAPVAALEAVSLSTEGGSVLGLLGPNGAGKTTLLSVMAGLLPAQQGTIVVDGEPLASMRSRTPTKISVAPQDYAFFPALSVAENLACFAAAARLGGVRRAQRIVACLEFAQLKQAASTRADRLSGGMKRRLNLAIALLPEPDLILFDEPTVGVDPQTRAFVLDAIKSLARNGVAVIYASHYMEEIEALASHVVILDHGRVLRAGSLDDLLAEDGLSLTLLADGVAPESLRCLLAKHGTVEAQAGNRVSVRLLSPPAEVMATLDAAGVRIRRAEFGRQSLERLFLSLTESSQRDA